MVLPKVIFVTAVEKYCIQVHFNDDTQGLYDLAHLAGKGIFKQWDTDNNFSKVFIDNASGAVSWPGSIDLDTLTIYCKVKGITTDNYLETITDHATHQ